MEAYWKGWCLLRLEWNRPLLNLIWTITYDCFRLILFEYQMTCSNVNMLIIVGENDQAWCSYRKCKEIASGKAELVGLIISLSMSFLFLDFCIFWYGIIQKVLGRRNYHFTPSRPCNGLSWYPSWLRSVFARPPPPPQHRTHSSASIWVYQYNISWYSKE